ncbi:MAG: EVE domain-containing protein [Phycisphaeraceae bacterium]|nr:EVE domain-containing protein [Phycisphaeraceae bacterium]
MATLLLKADPGEYSFDDLARDKVARWDGITNAQALNFLRAARKGDEALIYHTGDDKAIVGLAKLASDPYPDPDDRALNARGEPKFVVADLAAVRRARSPVTLATIKADPRFEDFLLVTNSRLSIMAVPAALDRVLRAMAGL